MRGLLLAGCVLAAIGLTALTPVCAQAPQGPPASGPTGGMPPTGPLSVQQLTPTVYWVKGGVGNVGVIVGDKGVIVVDTTISPAGGAELLADIAKITPKPVTTVILTHGDVDHVGGLSAFPAGVTVIAHQGNKARMAAGLASGRGRTPADKIPGRVITASETVTIEGVKLGLLHWAPAHTDGDLVIFLPAQKIVFTGDIFSLDQPRALIHREQAGTSAGWLTTARGILALDADRFVVGHGEVQAKAPLKARLDLVSDEREQISRLVAAGKTLPEIQAAAGDPPPAPAGAGGGAPRFEPFSQVVYEELTEKK